MALWAAKNTGVMFGGVTDEDTNEETLESLFHNDLCVKIIVIIFIILLPCRNGYQISGNGRWFSMALKVPKKKGGSQKKVNQPQSIKKPEDKDEVDVTVDGESEFPDDEVNSILTTAT